MKDKKTKSPLTKEQIKEFKELEEKAENNTARCFSYRDDEFEYLYGNLAEDLCRAGDKEWARKIYKIAEEKINRGEIDLYYYCALANDIMANLNDKELAKKVYK